ncbi:MAG TPA: carboxypeptidase-like regulatory domain-containing protein [Planctomycetota bacterium]
MRGASAAGWLGAVLLVGTLLLLLLEDSLRDDEAAPGIQPDTEAAGGAPARDIVTLEGSAPVPERREVVGHRNVRVFVHSPGGVPVSGAKIEEQRAAPAGPLWLGLERSRVAGVVVEPSRRGAALRAVFTGHHSESATWLGEAELVLTLIADPAAASASTAAVFGRVHFADPTADRERFDVVLARAEPEYPSYPGWRTALDWPGEREWIRVRNASLDADGNWWTSIDLPAAAKTPFWRVEAWLQRTGAAAPIPHIATIVSPPAVTPQRMPMAVSEPFVPVPGEELRAPDLLVPAVPRLVATLDRLALPPELRDEVDFKVRVVGRDGRGQAFLSTVLATGPWPEETALEVELAPGYVGTEIALLARVEELEVMSPVHVLLPGRTDLGRITPPPLGRVAGLVHERAGGRGVVDWRVVLLGEAPRTPGSDALPLRVSHSRKTDADGRFETPWVPAGEYRLQLDQAPGGVLAAPRVQAVLVPAGGTLEVDLEVGIDLVALELRLVGLPAAWNGFEGLALLRTEPPVSFVPRAMDGPTLALRVPTNTPIQALLCSHLPNRRSNRVVVATGRWPGATGGNHVWEITFQDSVLTIPPPPEGGPWQASVGSERLPPEVTRLLHGIVPEHADRELEIRGLPPGSWQITLERPGEPPRTWSQDLP